MSDHNPDELLDDAQMERADLRTVIKLIFRAIRAALCSRPGQIMALSFGLMMLWGYHGELELLRLISKSWRGPGIDIDTRPPIIGFVPWDQELIAFWAGAFLLVVIPILIIKLAWKEKLSDYGLGLPPRGRRRFAIWSFVTLTGFCLLPFYVGAQDESMQAVYPFYKHFANLGSFVLYQLTYLPFFLAIEFIFRGFLLFGLARHTDKAENGAPRFPTYALLIQMLPYIAWHLGKPIPELWGTPLWGLAAGAVAFASRSIWPVVLAHWLLNVWLDAASLGYF